MSNPIVSENTKAPGIYAIESIAELRRWKENQGERSNIARIPLAKRTNQTALPIPTMVGFDCGEFAYDPWFTAWSQGAQGKSEDGNRTAANVYNFSFWQYVDISYYISHNLLTIPPTVWTNACHKNGVISLGTLNFNLDDSHGKFVEADVIAFLTPKPNNPDPTKVYLEEGISILKAVASYFGFDGWLFNVEKAYPEVVEGMLTMLSTLKSEGCYTAWYDSPFSGGYAYRLTDEGWTFLKSANFFQSDYGWDKQDGYPKKSFDVIAAHAPGTKLEERNNMFMAKYCSNRGGTQPYTNANFFDAFDSIKTPDSGKSEDPQQYYTGLGVYYPAWVMYDMRADNKGKNTDKLPDRETFHHNDQAFWTGTKDSIIFPDQPPLNIKYEQCMRNYIKERSVITSLPFVTCFNDGEGDYYNLGGSTYSTGPWNNLSDQNVLPTYRFFLKESMRSNKTTIAHPSDPSLVFSGGSCLSVDLDKLDGLVLPLFKMQVLLPEGVQISLIRKQTNVSSESIIMSLSDGRSIPLNSPVIKPLQLGWEKAIFYLPGELTGKVVTEIGLELKTASSDATYYLGQFSFRDNDTDPPPKVFTFGGDLEELNWSQHYSPPYSPSYHFLVWGELQDAWHLLGVVYNWVYRVKYGSTPSTNIFNSNLTGFKQYKVCEVNEMNASILPWQG
ncbi:MAG TPA: hypothetical protein V6C97_19670 [Oculatellaceae cyanobacterium]